MPRPSPRSHAHVLALAFLAAIALACFASLPYTLAPAASSIPRYNAGSTSLARLPPAFTPHDHDHLQRLADAIPPQHLHALASSLHLSPDQLLASPDPAHRRALLDLAPSHLLGTDALGRSVLLRLLTGGAVSLSIALAAAALSVSIGTLYGALAGYLGGRADAILMRLVDILYGLPYVLLVVLLAVASDSLLDEFLSRSHARARFIAQHASTQQLDADPALAHALAQQAAAALPARHISDSTFILLDVATLLLAIASVSWLTMARVIRGQVLSLKNQPFVDAAKALGLHPARIFLKHLLPNLVGPIVVYATLIVPQAILQESFLSFLGIGVKPPLPSWGNLAADGLPELNPYRSNWWLLAFPCLLLALTLLALNLLGERLRTALDPKSLPR